MKYIRDKFCMSLAFTSTYKCTHKIWELLRIAYMNLIALAISRQTILHKIPIFDNEPKIAVLMSRCGGGILLCHFYTSLGMTLRNTSLQVVRVREVMPVVDFVDSS